MDISLPTCIAAQRVPIRLQQPDPTRQPKPGRVVRDGQRPEPAREMSDHWRPGRRRSPEAVVHVENATRWCGTSDRPCVHGRLLPEVVHLETVDIFEAAVREGHTLRGPQLGL